MFSLEILFYTFPKRQREYANNTDHYGHKYKESHPVWCVLPENSQQSQQELP